MNNKLTDILKTFNIVNNPQPLTTNQNKKPSVEEISIHETNTQQNATISAAQTSTTELEELNEFNNILDNLVYTTEINKETTDNTDVINEIDTEEKTQKESKEDYALSEIEKEIQQRRAEIEAKENSMVGLGALGNGIAGLFGKGTSGELKELEELQKLYEEIKKNPTEENIASLYKSLNGVDINWSAIEASQKTSQSLSNGDFLAPDGSVLTQEDIANSLVAMAENLDSSFNEDVSSQGIISKIINFTNNNILGIGQTQNMTQAQINELKGQINKLAETTDPKEFAALYKQITGEDLTQESLSQLLSGESKVQNTAASEAIMDYEETQENAKTAVTSTIVGIATGAMGPIGGMLVGAGLNAVLNGVDAVTKTDGKPWTENLLDYVKSDLLEDVALGAVSGLAGGVGNKASKWISGLGKEASKGMQILARVGGEFAEGGFDGAISNAGEYLIDVAKGEKEFSLKDMLAKTGEGLVFGGIASVGLQEAGGLIGGALASKAVADIADDIPTKNLTPAFKDAPIVKELDPSHSYGKSIVDKNTGEAFIWDKTDNRWVRDLKTEKYAKQAELEFGKSSEIDTPQISGTTPDIELSYSGLKNGDMLPKNTKIQIDGTEKLNLAGYELDLNSPETQKLLGNLREGDSITIGRNPNSTIKINSNYQSASRTHLTIQKSNGKLILTDTSSYGTRIAQMTPKTDISSFKVGDRLTPGADIRIKGNEKLILATSELDLSSPEIQNMFNNMRNGEVITVGRVSGNHIRIDDPKVSARHLTIEKQADGFHIKDLSSNGTKLDNPSQQAAWLKSRGQNAAGNNPNIINAGNKMPKDTPIKINGTESFEMQGYRMYLSDHEIQKALNDLKPGEKIVFGRDGRFGFELDAKNNKISSRHLEIQRTSDGFVAIDRSLNGTTMLEGGKFNTISRTIDTSKITPDVMDKLNKIDDPEILSYMQNKFSGRRLTNDDIKEMTMLADATNCFDKKYRIKQSAEKGYYLDNNELEAVRDMLRGDLDRGPVTQMLYNDGPNINFGTKGSEALRQAGISESGFISDAKLEDQLYAMKKYIQNFRDTEASETFYRQYLTLLKENGVPNNIIEKIGMMNMQYNVKVFPTLDPSKYIGGYGADGFRALNAVEYELHAWYKASGGKAKLPPTIDFTNVDKSYLPGGNHLTGGMAGGHSASKTHGAISVNGMNESSVKWTLRHETMHSNDIKCGEGIFLRNRSPQAQKLLKMLQNKNIGSRTISNIYELPYIQELINAGILSKCGEDHIKYAFNNTLEFIAVAAEGNMSKYSEEFIQILEDLGMPYWMRYLK